VGGGGVEAVATSQRTVTCVGTNETNRSPKFNLDLPSPDGEIAIERPCRGIRDEVKLAIAAGRCAAVCCYMSCY
jgi:hypothetical protein